MKQLNVGFLLLCIILSACTALPAAMQPAAEADAITFMAGYKPQANLPFVGVYVAKEKGFFAEENLDVTVEHSPGSGQHLQLVAAGKVQVTTQDASVLLKRRADPGLPLVSFGLIGQRGQQAYAALTSSGIQTVEDWRGRTVGYKGTPAPDVFALIKAAGLQEQDVELVNVGFDPRLLSEGKVDVYPVYKSNEPYMLKQWGYDLVLWEASDFGLPNLGLAYVTSDETLAQQPDVLARFLRAALRGIEYAREHPDEAVEYVIQYAGPETDPAHMRFMLDSELADLESEVTDQYGVGWSTAEQWQELADMLIEYEAMPPVEVESVFTNSILERAQAE
jgi:ABC-type nitrate/sulfonate/bicarbonate transport system substrate-binding protein